MVLRAKSGRGNIHFTKEGFIDLGALLMLCKVVGTLYVLADYLC